MKLTCKTEYRYARIPGRFFGTLAMDHSPQRIAYYYDVFFAYYVLPNTSKIVYIEFA